MNVQSPVLEGVSNDCGDGMEIKKLVLSRKCDPCSDSDPEPNAKGGAGNDCGVSISVLRDIEGILVRC